MSDTSISCYYGTTESDITKRKIIADMILNGVKVYGAGKRGSAAIKALQEAEIEIHGLSDQIIGKKCCGYTSVSIDDFIENADCVCIVTPAAEIADVVRMLKKAFHAVITDLQLIEQLKYLYPRDMKDYPYMSCKPFNHWESPYPSYEDIERFKVKYEDRTVDGIDMKVEEQLKKLRLLKKSVNKFEDLLQKKALRYKGNNGWFNEKDAAFLYAMLLQERPRQIIEVGSGFSTATILDAKGMDDYVGGHFTCIEPNADRLKSILHGNLSRRFLLF